MHGVAIRGIPTLEARPTLEVTPGGRRGVFLFVRQICAARWQNPLHPQQTEQQQLHAYDCSQARLAAARRDNLNFIPQVHCRKLRHKRGGRGHPGLPTKCPSKRRSAVAAGPPHAYVAFSCAMRTSRSVASLACLVCIEIHHS